MRNISLLLIVLITALNVIGQDTNPIDSSWKKIPRYTPTRTNNLVHTKLDVQFDFDKSHLLGKAWITLTPHIDPTDSLRLDAKGMELHDVSIIGKNNTTSKLIYSYDGLQLNIKLPKLYSKGELYTIYISYTSMPNEYEEASGADPMLGVKGLFFINPKGEIKNKPTQIWTQGETESNSVWFPTIDQTQQKTTQEIYMTVPTKYVTLSNGVLVNQKLNKNGTRTDYWKMTLPHSPYHFFMGVGDYAIIKDHWKGKEVNYYVEPEFGPVAKKIFGNTPEMMSYFSKITGVEYPWNKYAQITGIDYVSGAMENTTATLHQESAQQDARELTDGNRWESTIAHELFHQWFGDYVTAESWSNLTLNESFADYSQTLWNQYKYGKDAGDAENHTNILSYLRGNNAEKNLVRFYYADREDMFDAVSYQKGGAILHMLRNHIGDSAFFKGLNVYLTTNKFKSAEAAHLRLALEETSGRDLSWFFNQWYYGSGHPKLDITYSYVDSSKSIKVIVKQTQKTGKIFRIPSFIDIYAGDKKTRNQIWIENPIDTFTFSSLTKPDLINFDGDKVLLCEKKENKNIDNYFHQYYFAGKYLDRRESVEFCGRKMDNTKAIQLLKDALKDPFDGIRELALTKIDLKKESIRKEFEPIIASLLIGEKNIPLKANRIGVLGNTLNTNYKDIYLKNVKDSSYSVSGKALTALSKIDSALALKIAIDLSHETAKGELDAAINKILIASGNEEIYDKLAEKFTSLGLSNEKIMVLQQIAEMTGNMKSNERIKNAIGLIINFRNELPTSLKEQINPYVNQFLLPSILKKLKENGNTEMMTYLENQMK
jgi:aminopeptidase N